VKGGSGKGEGMNLRQCWFRFQRATTKPLEKAFQRSISLACDTTFPMRLIGRSSDLIEIPLKSVDSDPRPEVRT